MIYVKMRQAPIVSGNIEFVVDELGKFPGTFKISNKWVEWWSRNAKKPSKKYDWEDFINLLVRG